MTPFSYDWIKTGQILACSFPLTPPDLETLESLGVSAILSLDERPTFAESAVAQDLEVAHLPVPDFSPPAPDVLDAVVAFVQANGKAGRVVAVHCRGGLGRTGTALACVLVAEGFTAIEAIATLRKLRPGSIETPEQEAAVIAWTASRDVAGQ